VGKRLRPLGSLEKRERERERKRPGCPVTDLSFYKDKKVFVTGHNGFTIGVFGLGFVGLTTALGFAEKDFTVYGFDTDKKRVATISNGSLPFLEPGLDVALKKHLNTRFIVAESAEQAALKSDVIFFCVGTPCGEHGTADLTHLFSALESITLVLSDGKFRLLVTKSTIPPGTVQNEVIPRIEGDSSVPAGSFAFAHNPEFLREGSCWEDFINPDRIVCGVSNEKAAAVMRKIYEPFNAPIHIVTLNTAEYIKYLSNTLLATLISFSNEMSLIADGIGDIDIGRSFRILHEDKRLRGSGIASYIYPGCGYGGYCLPKDTLAMSERAKAHGVRPGILENVIVVNDNMPLRFFEKIMKAAVSDRKKNIGILGLSFKPDSDDVRDSPAAKIINLLLKNGFEKIYAYDPAANGFFDKLYKFSNVKYFDSKEAVCRTSDIIVVVTIWKEFKNIRASFPDKQWIDCRYFLN
jgi:UDPglucose 6-dehydrogenase